MIKFIKSLWLGLKFIFSLVIYSIIFLLPAIIGLSLGLFLSRYMEISKAAFISLVSIVIGYWLFYTIPHYVNAIKYLKVNGTTSLKDAWKNTSC